MKQNINDTQTTKSDLNKLEKKLKKGFKDEFDSYDKKLTKRLLDSQEAFRKELYYKFQIQDDNWDRRFTKFANQILTAIDPLLQELKTRQQEREIAAAQITYVRDTVNDHEKRITKLEHS